MTIFFNWWVCVCFHQMFLSPILWFPRNTNTHAVNYIVKYHKDKKEPTFNIFFDRFICLKQCRHFSPQLRHLRHHSDSLSDCEQRRVVIDVQSLDQLVDGPRHQEPGLSEEGWRMAPRPPEPLKQFGCHVVSSKKALQLNHHRLELCGDTDMERERGIWFTH